MSSAGRRERTIDCKVGSSGRSLIDNKTGQIVGSNTEAYQGKTLYTGRQITESESHRYDPKQGRYDGGGPFYTGLIEHSVGSPQVTIYEPNSSTSSFEYRGPMWMPLPTDSELSGLGASYTTKFRSEDLSDLNTDGATAISACSPANPASTLGTGLAETFREGVPTLPGIKAWRDRTAVARAAGSEFLNAEFGWLPLVSEVNDVVNTARHHRDIMNQYHKDEGSNVRRGFSFPVSRSTIQHFLPREAPRINTTAERTILANTLGEWRRLVDIEESTRKWFSGCFTYGLPSSFDSWKRAIGFGSDADKLFGIALSPDVLWELTPWSWAVDWFTNAGDVINNVSNFGLAGQVMRYGFMMEERIQKVTISGVQVPGSAADYSSTGTPGSSYPTEIKSSYTIRTKVRSKANPFGFGLTDLDLSPTQLLITAALGITRL